MTPIAVILAVLLLGSSSSCRKRDADPEPAAAPAAAVSALPGARPHPDRLRARLEKRLAELGPEHAPRTRHLHPDGSPKYVNRLLLEPSPYLAQHAHNPVDWYPWGEEALAAARELDRPIFLSIGYSTCHWCHVMEKESFEDEEIARYLNEHYVAIKVDREERPDVDSIYMAAVRAMGQDGGWPLNVWLTPDRKPYFGGTYFPPRDGMRGRRVGFMTVLERGRDFFVERREEVDQQGTLVAAAIGEQVRPRPGGKDEPPGPDVLHAAARFYRERFDDANGGLRADLRGNKFPSALPIRFLLRYHRRTGDERALEMAQRTLDAMAAGGLHDQVGGGFHRYSTDPRWLVPHFEKMLYDNARLAVAYLEAHQVTGDQEHLRIARGILAYVAREMTAPEGGFYSATDADSLDDAGERVEGWYFTWTPKEVRAVVGADSAELVIRHFGVTDRGDLGGRNVLHAARPLADVARELDLSEEEARARLDAARGLLLEARARRQAPHVDEKILTAWNGLMISAFARAAQVAGGDAERGLDYREISTRAADFVLDRMGRDGRLKRSFIDGQATIDGYLDDHAFLIAGLLDLFEATFEPRWLAEAVALDEMLAAQFEDPDGGFFMTGDDHEELIVREKPARDGSIPSGNSVAAMNLLRLYELTSEARYLERADLLLRAFSRSLAERPSELDVMLLALDFRTDVALQIVLVTPESVEQAAPFFEVLGGRFLPNRVVVAAAEGPALALLAGPVPLIGGKRALRGRPTAYVCEQGRCELPTPDPAVFARQIARVAPLDR